MQGRQDMEVRNTCTPDGRAVPAVPDGRAVPAVPDGRAVPAVPDPSCAVPPC